MKDYDEYLKDYKNPQWKPLEYEGIKVEVSNIGQVRDPRLQKSRIRFIIRLEIHTRLSGFQIILVLPIALLDSHLSIILITSLI